MSIQKNVTATLKLIHIQSKLSLVEFAEALGIGRSSLQEYLPSLSGPLPVALCSGPHRFRQGLGVQLCLLGQLVRLLRRHFLNHGEVLSRELPVRAVRGYRRKSERPAFRTDDQQGG